MSCLAFEKVTPPLNIQKFSYKLNFYCFGCCVLQHSHKLLCLKSHNVMQVMTDTLYGTKDFLYLLEIEKNMPYLNA